MALGCHDHPVPTEWLAVNYIPRGSPSPKLKMHENEMHRHASIASNYPQREGRATLVREWMSWPRG